MILPEEIKVVNMETKKVKHLDGYRDVVVHEEGPLTEAQLLWLEEQIALDLRSGGRRGTRAPLEARLFHLAPRMVEKIRELEAEICQMKQ